MEPVYAKLRAAHAQGLSFAQVRSFNLDEYLGLPRTHPQTYRSTMGRLLWYHGWTFEGRHNFAKAFWARGNSWATIAIPELMSIVPDLPAAEKRILGAVFQSQVKTLTDLQCEDGFFRTLLNDDAAQIESSATAGIAYGISRGIELGLIDDSYRVVADRAFDAVVRCIDDDGIVTHCSDGTPMGHTLQFYKDIPDIPAPYGQALTMLMLVEAMTRQTDKAELADVPA